MYYWTLTLTNQMKPYPNSNLRSSASFRPRLWMSSHSLQDALWIRLRKSQSWGPLKRGKSWWENCAFCFLLITARTLGHDQRVTLFLISFSGWRHAQRNRSFHWAAGRMSGSFEGKGSCKRSHEQVWGDIGKTDPRRDPSDEQGPRLYEPTPDPH